MVARNSLIVKARRLYKTNINVSPIAISRAVLLNMTIAFAFNSGCKKGLNSISLAKSLLSKVSHFIFIVNVHNTY